MNHVVKKIDPDGNEELITLSQKSSDKNIVSMTLTDKGELMFMDTNLKLDSGENKDGSRMKGE